MADPVRIAVAGAGLIGRRHVEEVDASADAVLAAIVDHGPAGPELAARFGVPVHRSLDDLFATDPPDGVVLATPNQAHVEGGLACVAAGVPVIVEKPIADSVAGATRLVEAGEAAGVPVLTGPHRNNSTVMAAARAIVRSGRLGRIVAVTGTALFHKPDDYFDVGGGWRRLPGGGPVLLNLIHDVNALLSLVGDVVQGAGGDVERDPRLPRRGHRGDGVHLRERRPRHVPALRRRCVAPVVGADVRGERRLPDAPRRGLLPPGRDRRLALRPDDARPDLPGRPVLVDAVRLVDRARPAPRPPRRADHALRRRHPGRGRARLQRP